MRKNRICERCGKQKSVEDFISRIYPERGPGTLCQFCRRKDQRKPTYKQKKKLEVQKRRIERKKKAIARKYEKARYVKIRKDSAKWLKYMKSEGRIWDCGVPENAKLWREYIELTNNIPGFAKKAALLEIQSATDELDAKKVRR